MQRHPGTATQTNSIAPFPLHRPPNQERYSAGTHINVLFVHLFVCRSVCLSACLSVCLFVRLVFVFVCLIVCFVVCLFVCLIVSFLLSLFLCFVGSSFSFFLLFLLSLCLFVGLFEY